jgi:competence protein ComEA
MALATLARIPAPQAQHGRPRVARALPSVAAVAGLRDGQPLDLNRALPADLVLLPGVGPKLAQRIIDERARRSGFKSVDELSAVKGVGPKKLEQLRGLVRVGPAQPAPAGLVTDRTAPQTSGMP